MIAIIDYEMCNVGSVRNMLKRIGVQSIITSDKDEIATAEKIILPGVGAFDNGMQKLYDLDLIDVLNHQVLVEKKPVLGICLGMQLITKSSDEGMKEGLGWIDAHSLKFNLQDQYRIPHMGWNFTTVVKQNELTKDLLPNSRFYFVHSYFVKCKNEEDIILTCKYDKVFTAALHRENVYGLQFHPEKSHKYGMQLLKMFSNLKVLTSATAD